MIHFIFYRWKRKSDGEIAHDETTGAPILQFVSVQRRDNGEWALPGVSSVLAHQIRQPGSEISVLPWCSDPVVHM